MKTAKEILFVKGVFNELHKAGKTELLKDIQDCMKEYAKVAINEILSKERGDIVPESEILKVKESLK